MHSKMISIECNMSKYSSEQYSMVGVMFTNLILFK